jgi:catechol 2,3-dioxygenase-like lactoylglutathione lyase family enzyme
MDLDTVDAPDFGRSLCGLTLNLLVRDVRAEVAFLTAVFGIVAHRTNRDYAILGYAGQLLQLHADATYHANPVPALLPEAGPRGAGVEIRLHETDPDEAVVRAAAFPDAIVLAAPADKPHGLREAYLLCPNGYTWVPSRRIGG